MNLLTGEQSVAELLSGRFHSVIVTDIVLSNGQDAQMVTLISHRGMFDETVVGIDKGLRSGDKAAKWQSRVYSFVDGELTAPIAYKPVVMAETHK